MMLYQRTINVNEVDSSSIQRQVHSWIAHAKISCLKKITQHNQQGRTENKQEYIYHDYIDLSFIIRY